MKQARPALLYLLLGLVGVESAVAIDIFVRGVRDGQVAMGQIEVTLEVLSAKPVSEVEIRLDAELVARLSEEPFAAWIDFGEENRSRTLEVTVRDAEGATATRTIVTGQIRIDEEVDLELQQLYVTASRNGKCVLDLSRGEFAVFDDDERQRIVTFERGDVPLTAALLVDSSHSMEGQALSAALAGARAFIEAMAELDRAKVFVFSDRLLATTPFTGNPAEISSVMTRVSASGGTAVHDHLYLALNELDQEQGRRVVVLLSDGIDGESVLEMADVEWKSGRSQSLIYWIRLGAGAEGGHSSIWRDIEASRRQLEDLERAVLRSGGRVTEIASLEEAASAFRGIVAEMREQYVIGYYPENDRNDGSWHRVKVRVAEPGVRVRAREGYYDDRP